MPNKLTYISLFTGAGGLDYGLDRAGFRCLLCADTDKSSIETLLANYPNRKLSRTGDVTAVTGEEILEEASVRPGEIDLLAGGPPCQPFSKSSLWAQGGIRGLSDPRANTISAFLNLIPQLLPRVVLLENVEGMVGSQTNAAKDYIVNAFKKINKKANTNYEPSIIKIDSASYGVPQKRERIFVLAERSGLEFKIPPPTHGDSPNLESYRTAWDAIGDISEIPAPSHLDLRGKWAELIPTIPEGQNYQWHTSVGGGLPIFGYRTRYWSFLLKLAKNRPSWTIQAQPGPATGPIHWNNRYLSIREICRLQTFPDSYVIKGDYREAFRQVGNAVPCAIGELLGLEIQRQFFDKRVRKKLMLIPDIYAEPARKKRRAVVPHKFRNLKKIYSAHPGVGLGPRAQLMD